jgi:hypothetical protein
MNTAHAYWGLALVVVVFSALCVLFAFYVLPKDSQIAPSDTPEDDDVWSGFKDSTMQLPDNPSPYKYGMPSSKVKHERNKPR